MKFYDFSMQAFLESQALCDSREEADDLVISDNVTCAWMEDGSVLRIKDANSVNFPSPHLSVTALPDQEEVGGGGGRGHHDFQKVNFHSSCPAYLRFFRVMTIQKVPWWRKWHGGKIWMLT